MNDEYLKWTFFKKEAGILEMRNYSITCGLYWVKSMSRAASLEEYRPRHRISNHLSNTYSQGEYLNDILSKRKQFITDCGFSCGIFSHIFLTFQNAFKIHFQ